MSVSLRRCKVSSNQIDFSFNHVLKYAMMSGGVRYCLKRVSLNIGILRNPVGLNSCSLNCSYNIYNLKINGKIWLSTNLHEINIIK